ncbi:hypothetical protein B0H14DRAFT_1630724 [Mycena olivaceomarginata]|nr:hypothetical protein B0H14DRAFT_1630724 [Mycena olivaceomarginata]
MQLLTLKTRAVYQNTPVSSCQEFAGVCLHDAAIFISIVIFAGGLLLLTLGRHFWAPRQRHDSEEDHAESDPSPPSYSSIGFPPSASHDLALYKGSASPSLDPYHVVAPSFDNSLLLKDEYFSRVPCPEPTLLPNQQHPSSGVGLGLGFGDNSTQAGLSIPAGAPPPPLTSPPPAYVRRDATADRTL